MSGKKSEKKITLVSKQTNEDDLGSRGKKKEVSVERNMDPELYRSCTGTARDRFEIVVSDHYWCAEQHGNSKPH